MKLTCQYILSDFNYHLPPELIAQTPLPARDASRLLVVERRKNAWEHRHFRDLPEYLIPGDLLVLNKTKVIPARFWAKRESGASLEVMLLRTRDSNGCWEALLKPGKRAKTGEYLLSEEVKIKVIEKDPAGKVILEFPSGFNLAQFLETQGVAPLPPYIKRPHVGTEQCSVPTDKPSPRMADLERYQTVYAQETGAVAAPTAGLHFTPELLREIERQGVETAYVTLHVGWGTFKPVKVERIEEHQIEPEYFIIDKDTASKINRAKQEGRRIVAVGTTTVRALETVGTSRRIASTSGESTLFIYPPYEFKIVDAMVTNFHLPQSTLLMLISALAGKELIMAAYEEAIRERYRFYSYGDAMLIL